MRAGDLDRRIVLEQNTPTRDSLGAPIASWATFATVWAQVRPQRGTEPFQGDQENPRRPTTFRLRYRGDLTEDMRIVYAGDTYDIESIAEIGRQEGLEITATAQPLAV